MNAALAHRGPDDEGVEVWPRESSRTVLGHRRLAIIDLSPGGHQPMLSDDRQVGLVFNGCIYNFQDIRRELEDRGRQFRSKSDTEVLLVGYQEWGIDGLVPKLRGMFAFVLWDHVRSRLWLVRDRLGVKPLYYATGNDEVAFASTPTALMAAGFGGDIDAQAVLEFLHYGFVSGERSIRHGIRKVPPGTVVEWRDGKEYPRCYWSVPDVDPESRIGFDVAVDATEELLLEATRLRLYADVPIGVLLSAGIDSALVCWAMAKLNVNLRSFTVSTPGDPADESAEARRTAQLLGIPHEIVPLPRETMPDLDTLVDAYGEPLAASSALGVLRVSRAVKPFATVLLTGDGGDDVFLGYPFHQSFLTAQRLAHFLPSSATWLWRPVHQRLESGRSPWRRAQHLFDFATGGIGAVTRLQHGLPYLERHQMLGARLERRTLPERDAAMSVSAARNLLKDGLQHEYRTRFVEEFLTKVDGGTMYSALEARSPFLDQRMWEFAARLPYGVRLHNGELKAILREIVRRRVGPEVAQRQKRGFTVPVARWLASHWRPALEELTACPLLERQGWIRAGALQAMVRHTVETGSAPLALWHALVLNHWLMRHA
jgi:asparagine synthase (glutamine-hydrolysing)